MNSANTKLTRSTEWIFETAVALERDLKIKNVVLCRGSNIWIVNFDRTLILKYPVSGEFKNDISFYAADYDSANFLEENGTLHFVKYYDEYERKKVSSAVFTLSDVNIENLWKELMVKKPYDAEFVLNDKILSLFREDLSHVEIQINPETGIQFVQKDIFAGTVIYLKRKEKQGLFKNPNEKIVKAMEPIALRLVDLSALIYKEGNVRFSLSASSPGRCYVQTAKFEALISWCVYDELGKVTYVKEVHTPSIKKHAALKLRQEKKEIRNQRNLAKRTSTKQINMLGLRQNLAKRTSK